MVYCSTGIPPSSRENTFRNNRNSGTAADHPLCALIGSFSAIIITVNSGCDITFKKKIVRVPNGSYPAEFRRRKSHAVATSYISKELFMCHKKKERYLKTKNE